MIPLALGILLGAAPAALTLDFEQVGPEAGLPSYPVEAIVQDHEGFLWIATRGGGLARYDGHRVQMFQHDPDNANSPSHSALYSLLVARDGAIWLGSQDGDLDRLDPRTERFTHYGRVAGEHWAPEGQMPTNRVFALAEDLEGTIWLGTADNGVVALDPSTRAVRRYEPNPEDPNAATIRTRHLFVDSAGQLWLGGHMDQDAALSRWDPASNSFVHHRCRPDDPIHSADMIDGIAPGPKGSLWVATHHGLHTLDPRTGTLDRIEQPPEVFGPMTVERGGAVWAVQRREAPVLVRYEPGDRSWRRFRVPVDDAQINALFIDRSDVLWVASSFGLYRASVAGSRVQRFRNDPSNLNSPPTAWAWDAYEAPNGVLWITTANGLVRFDRGGPSFDRILPDGSINSEYGNQLGPITGTSGALWICARGTGLKRIDIRTYRAQHFGYDPSDPSKPPFSEASSLPPTMYTDGYDGCNLTQDAEGRLWVLSRVGLTRLDPRTGAVTHFPFEPLLIHWRFRSAVHVSRDGHVWAGTANGLFELDPASGKVTRFEHDSSDSTSISPGAVWSILETDDGTLWFALSQGHLDRRNERGAFIHYHPLGEPDLGGRRAFFDRAITGLADAGSGDLWLSVLGRSLGVGLVRFRPATGEARRFGRADGLHEEYHGVLRLRSGELLLTGTQGIDIFDPRGLSDDERQAAQVAISGVEIDDARVVVPRPEGTSVPELRVGYRHNVVGIDFTALDFTAPSLHRFRYRLDGVHDWVETSRDRVAYTHLPSGSHLFTVRASTQPGVWSDTGATMQIVVAPPPWRTWWAYTGYGLLFLGLLFGGVHYREQHRERRRLAAWNRELEDRVAAAAREIRETEAALLRSGQLARFGEFAATVAHDLKTPLTAIRGELELLEESVRAGSAPAEEILSTVETLLEQSRAMRAEIDRAMQFASPGAPEGGSADARAVLDELAAMLKTRASQSKVMLTVEGAETLPVAGSPDQLRHVVANLVVNAIEAQPEGGAVVVSGTKRNGAVEIRVRDEGPGIPEDIRDRLFEPFVSSKGEAGRGLGLASCKRIVEEQIGGTLTLEDAAGAGASFVVRLPVAADNPSPKLAE